MRASLRLQQRSCLATRSSQASWCAYCNSAEDVTFEDTTAKHLQHSNNNERSDASRYMRLSGLQISQLLPYFVLPHEGRSDEGMIAAITQVLITGKFFGDARCSAKMSILHYITLQPDLMLRETNLMLRLLKLVTKMQPNMNGQVSSSPRHCLLTCHVMEQQVAFKGHIGSLLLLHTSNCALPLGQ